jgi:hypothetical protein
MKKLFGFILAFAFAAVAQAQWLSGSVTNGVHLLHEGAGSLAYLQLTDSSGSANQVILYDHNSAGGTNRVSPGYTGTMRYATNIVRTWVTSTGTTNTRTDTVLFTAPLVVAQSTNEATRIFTVTIPANGAVTIDPPEALGFTHGVVLKNAGAMSYNIRKW